VLSRICVRGDGLIAAAVSFVDCSVPCRTTGHRPSFMTTPSVGSAFEGARHRELRARVEVQFECEFVIWLLERHDGNVSAAARYANMGRNHLSDLARRHGIDRAGRGRPRA